MRREASCTCLALAFPFPHHVTFSARLVVRLFCKRTILDSMKRQRLLVSFVVSISFICVHASAKAQGSLTPPGPPAPTMQSLKQLGDKLDQANTKLDQTNTKLDQANAKAAVPGEARSNLQAAPAPAGVDTTNATYQFVINQPGSYYLSANLGVTKANGILIDAEGVTLDLNGFEISRTSGTAGDGIAITATSHRATVRSGSIKGFGNGIAGGPARSCAFQDLVASNCISRGFSLPAGAVVVGCRAHDNTGSAGIDAGAGSSLTNCSAHNNATDFGITTQAGCSLANCVASNNTAKFGIAVGNGSSLSNCSAYANNSSASVSAGILTSSGCSITNCTAASNTSAAVSTPTTGMGFYVGSNNVLHGCAARSNEGDGIYLEGGTLAHDNASDGNGLNGDGAGIHADGSDNRVESNNVTNNDRGIDVDAVGNLIIRNSASGNGPTNNLNYVIVADNRYGPILNITATGTAAVNGNSAADTTTTTHPWANFSY